MIYSLMFPVNIFALPQGGQVVGGQANISVPNAALMQINQLSNKAIIDWNSFSIAHPELVQFMQPGANSIALNKVLGGDPSQIFGTLSANGGVWLINPAGILVGSTGVINVNSLLLSTLDINNEDFLSGNYVFNQMLNTTLASIVNQGTITAAQGGHVSLLSPGIVNQGTILASLGKVNLGAGEQATLNFVGNEMISFAIDKAVADKVRGPDGQELENGILNEGIIAAEGGEIVISARNAYDAIKSVVNNKGIIEAQTIGNINGTIVLDGGEKGIVYNSGTLDVSGMDAGETGGEIQVTGEKVGLIHYSEFKAMGRKGGGKVYAGGGYQGKDSAIRNAKRTFVGKDAKINADAIDEGDGGEVIVWADETTRAYGTITAKGGAVSGDGGLIETSGKSFLDVSGISINASALNGLNGTWLLDPRNVIIHATDVTMLTYDTGSDPHTFTPAGDTSKILYTDIANSLTNNCRVSRFMRLSCHVS